MAKKNEKVSSGASGNRTVKMVTLAMLSAAALILYIIEIPLPVAAFGNLKYDLSDIPALAAGLSFGPWYGVMVELIKNVLQLLLRGLGSQMGFGNLMNFLVGSAFVLPFAAFYKIFKKHISSAALPGIFSSLISMVCITVLGIAGNYFIAPLFFKYFLGQTISHDFLISWIGMATALNAFKGIILCITGSLMSPLLSRLLKKH